MNTKVIKSQTFLRSASGLKYNKLNQGDLVFCFQANRTNNDKAQYGLITNMDWSFDKPTTPDEIKSFLGSILSSVEEVFGEKMVTEAIMHYATEMNHIETDIQGRIGMALKSKGLKFKEFKNNN